MSKAKIKHNWWEEARFKNVLVHVRKINTTYNQLRDKLRQIPIISSSKAQDRHIAHLWNHLSREVKQLQASFDFIVWSLKWSSEYILSPAQLWST